MEPEKKKKITWLRVLFAFGAPLPTAVLVFFIFYMLYLGWGSLIFLILLILTVLAYLGCALYILLDNSEPNTTSAPVKDSGLTSNESTAFTAGLLGGVLLGRTLLKKNHSAQDDVNDFLWQEKIRRDMHDE